jgi:hypothetical protein
MAQAELSQNLVHGIAPVLQTLRQLEPETYKQIEKDLKNNTNDLRVAVQNDFPEKPWTSSTGQINWTKYGRTTRGRKPKGAAGASFPKWEAKKVKRGVVIQVGGRKVRRTNSYPILRIKQMNAAGAIYDLAKNQQGEGSIGRQFVQNLNATAKPSRVMWKSAAKNYPLVEHKILKILDDVGSRFTAQISRQTELRSAQSIRASKQARTALGRFGKML